MTAYTMNQHTITGSVDLLVAADDVDRVVHMYVINGGAAGYGFNGSVPGPGMPIQVLPTLTSPPATLVAPTTVVLPAGVDLSVTGLLSSSAVLYVVTKVAER